MVIDRLLGTRSYLAEPEREVGVSVNLPAGSGPHESEMVLLNTKSLPY